MYYPFVRKALLQLDPKHTHEFTSQQLRRTTGTPFEALVRQKVPAKPTNCMSLALKNPLGLAADLDKDGKCIDVLDTMGFGSIEIGTATSRPQPGNGEPRLLRLVDAEGLTNRMGFNSLGIDNLVENVERAHYNGVLSISIGRNKDTPMEQGKDDCLICMEKVYAYAGYIAINVSSPNTSGSCTPRHGEILDNLLTAIENKQNNLQMMYHEYVSIAVKTVPDFSEGELIQATGSLVHHNIGGIIATNITPDRSLIQGTKNYDQTGGSSGHLLQLKSAEIIRHLSQELNGRLPIIGVGGVDSVVAAREKTAAGASLVQICSGFISKGPSSVKETAIHI